MALEIPDLPTATPGRPITAQAWNEIVGGVETLFGAVQALGGGVLEVSVQFGGAPVPGAQVVAVPLGDGNPVAALPLFGDVTTYRVVGVTPGNWRIHVAADGFRPETRDVTVPTADPVVVNLTAAGVPVPDLFGVGGQEALARLSTAGLAVDLILDITGHEVPRVPLPPQYQNAPVLGQLPAAGTVVDPATGRLRLVLAAALEAAPVVTMPSLVGLTYDEVVKVLERLGLRVGTTTIRQTGP